MSKLFKDRPLNVTEAVVYWTEYVIRHKGAKHLRTAAVEMPWWKYHLIDVVSFILSMSFVVLYIIYYSLNVILKYLSKKTMFEEKEKKN